MSKIIIYILLFGFSLNAYGYKTVFRTGETLDCRKISFAENQDVGEEVGKAFAAFKKGNAQPLEDLKQHGEKVLPYLEQYLNDANLDVRRQVFYLATDIGGGKSLDLLASALRNSRLEIREETAAILYGYYSKNREYSLKKGSVFSDDYLKYKKFSPEIIGANLQIGEGLREFVKSGKSDYKTVFLLSIFPGNESAEVLEKTFSAKTSGKNKKSAADDSESALAAKIVLANFGRQDAVNYLTAAIGENQIEISKFLLKNINEIESSEILSPLVSTFDNKILIEGTMTGDQMVKKLKLPKGFHITPLPKRRLCDLAVNSFVKRFNLKVDFPLHITTYTENQISEVREMVELAVTK